MRSWSLNAKIIFVLALFAIGGATISVLGIKKIGDINAVLDNLVQTVTARMVISKSLEAGANDLTARERTLVLETSEEGMKVIATRIDNQILNVQTLLSELRQLSDSEWRGKIDQLTERFETWKKIHANIRTLAFSNQNAEATALTRNDSTVALEGFDEILRATVKRNEEIMAAESASADAFVEQTRNIIVTISLVAIFVCAILAFFILRALNKAIDQVISNLDDSSTQVTSAAQQIAASSEQLSQAATEQASSLEETAASIEEMNSMVQKNSENAGKSADISGESKTSAEKGQRVVTDMIQAIDDISKSNDQIMKQIDESNQKISEIVVVISEIGNKTKVINDIVFQTKLLSFNASVEAARAGEHGKGFAVVAEEVGNLAQMSGNAAKEIAEMLDGSIQKVEGIVTETKTKVEQLITHGKERVEAGTEIARQCGEVLNEIVGNVSNVGQMVSEISTACQEQSQGVQEITRAMSQLDQVTQENASTSEEAASAAEELSSQAESLREVVQILIETIKGSKGREAVATKSTKAVKTANPRDLDALRAGSSDEKVIKLKFNKDKQKPRTGNDGNWAQHDEFPMQRAVGFDGGVVPSENDPRFKDV